MTVRASVVACALVAVLLAVSARAATKTAVASGHWETASNWSPSGAPGSGDDVIIPDGKWLNISTNATQPAGLNSLTLGSTGNGALLMAVGRVTISIGQLTTSTGRSTLLLNDAGSVMIIAGGRLCGDFNLTGPGQFAFPTASNGAGVMWLTQLSSGMTLRCWNGATLYGTFGGSQSGAAGQTIYFDNVMVTPGKPWTFGVGYGLVTLNGAITFTPPYSNVYWYNTTFGAFTYNAPGPAATYHTLYDTTISANAVFAASSNAQIQFYKALYYTQVWQGVSWTGWSIIYFQDLTYFNGTAPFVFPTIGTGCCSTTWIIAPYPCGLNVTGGTGLVTSLQYMTIYYGGAPSGTYSYLSFKNTQVSNNVVFQSSNGLPYEVLGSFGNGGTLALGNNVGINLSPTAGVDVYANSGSVVRGSTSAFSNIYLQDGAILHAGNYYYVNAYSGTSTLDGMVSCYSGTVYAGATFVLTQYSSLSASYSFGTQPGSFVRMTDATFTAGTFSGFDGTWMVSGGSVTSYYTYGTFYLSNNALLTTIYALGDTLGPRTAQIFGPNGQWDSPGDVYANSVRFGTGVNLIGSIDTGTNLWLDGCTITSAFTFSRVPDHVYGPSAGNITTFAGNWPSVYYPLSLPLANIGGLVRVTSGHVQLTDGTSFLPGGMIESYGWGYLMGTFDASTSPYIAAGPNGVQTDGSLQMKIAAYSPNPIYVCVSGVWNASTPTSSITFAQSYNGAFNISNTFYTVGPGTWDMGRYANFFGPIPQQNFQSAQVYGIGYDPYGYRGLMTITGGEVVFPGLQNWGGPISVTDGGILNINGVASCIQISALYFCAITFGQNVPYGPHKLNPNGVVHSFYTPAGSITTMVTDVGLILGGQLTAGPTLSIGSSAPANAPYRPRIYLSSGPNGVQLTGTLSLGDVYANNFNAYGSTYQMQIGGALCTLGNVTIGTGAFVNPGCTIVGTATFGTVVLGSTTRVNSTGSVSAAVVSTGSGALVLEGGARASMGSVGGSSNPSGVWYRVDPMNGSPDAHAYLNITNLPVGSLIFSSVSKGQGKLLIGGAGGTSSSAGQNLGNGACLLPGVVISGSAFGIAPGACLYMGAQITTTSITHPNAQNPPVTIVGVDGQPPFTFSQGSTISLGRYAVGPHPAALNWTSNGLQCGSCGFSSDGGAISFKFGISVTSTISFSSTTPGGTMGPVFGLLNFAFYSSVLALLPGGVLTPYTSLSMSSGVPSIRLQGGAIQAPRTVPSVFAVTVWPGITSYIIGGSGIPGPVDIQSSLSFLAPGGVGNGTLAVAGDGVRFTVGGTANVQMWNGSALVCSGAGALLSLSQSGSSLLAGTIDATDGCTVAIANARVSPSTTLNVMCDQKSSLQFPSANGLQLSGGSNVVFGGGFGVAYMSTLLLTTVSATTTGARIGGALNLVNGTQSLLVGAPSLGSAPITLAANLQVSGGGFLVLGQNAVVEGPSTGLNVTNITVNGMAYVSGAVSLQRVTVKGRFVISTGSSLAVSGYLDAFAQGQVLGDGGSLSVGAGTWVRGLLNSTSNGATVSFDPLSLVPTGSMLTLAGALTTVVGGAFPRINGTVNFAADFPLNGVTITGPGTTALVGCVLKTGVTNVITTKTLIGPAAGQTLTIEAPNSLQPLSMIGGTIKIIGGGDVQLQYLQFYNLVRIQGTGSQPGIANPTAIYGDINVLAANAVLQVADLVVNAGNTLKMNASTTLITFAPSALRVDGSVWVDHNIDWDPRGAQTNGSGIVHLGAQMFLNTFPCDFCIDTAAGVTLRAYAGSYSHAIWNVRVPVWHGACTFTVSKSFNAYGLYNMSTTATELAVSTGASAYVWNGVLAGLADGYGTLMLRGTAVKALTLGNPGQNPTIDGRTRIDGPGPVTLQYLQLNSSAVITSSVNGPTSIYGPTVVMNAGDTFDVSTLLGWTGTGDITVVGAPGGTVRINALASTVAFYPLSYARRLIVKAPNTRVQFLSGPGAFGTQAQLYGDNSVVEFGSTVAVLSSANITGFGAGTRMVVMDQVLPNDLPLQGDLTVEVHGSVTLPALVSVGGIDVQSGAELVLRNNTVATTTLTVAAPATIRSYSRGVNVNGGYGLTATNTILKLAVAGALDIRNVSLLSQWVDLRAGGVGDSRITLSGVSEFRSVGNVLVSYPNTGTDGTGSSVTIVSADDDFLDDTEMGLQNTTLDGASVFAFIGQTNTGAVNVLTCFDANPQPSNVVVNRPAGCAPARAVYVPPTSLSSSGAPYSSSVFQSSTGAAGGAAVSSSSTGSGGGGGGQATASSTGSSSQPSQTSSSSTGGGGSAPSESSTGSSQPPAAESSTGSSSSGGPPAVQSGHYRIVLEFAAAPSTATQSWLNALLQLLSTQYNLRLARLSVVYVENAVVHTSAAVPRLLQRIQRRTGAAAAPQADVDGFRVYVDIAPASQSDDTPADTAGAAILSSPPTSVGGATVAGTQRQCADGAVTSGTCSDPDGGSGGGFPVMIVIYAVAGAVVLALIITAIVCCVRRRRNKSADNRKASNLEFASTAGGAGHAAAAPAQYTTGGGGVAELAPASFSDALTPTAGGNTTLPGTPQPPAYSAAP